MPVASLTLRQSRALPRSPSALHTAAAAAARLLLTGVRHFSFSRRRQQSTATQLHRDYFSLFSGRRANKLCLLTQIYVFFERSRTSQFPSLIFKPFYQGSIQPKPKRQQALEIRKVRTEVPLHRLKNEWLLSPYSFFLDLDKFADAASSYPLQKTR